MNIKNQLSIVIIFLLATILGCKEAADAPPSYGETEAQIIIHEAYACNLVWNDLKDIIVPLLERGILTVEVNDFRWTYAFLDGYPIEADPSPLLIKKKSHIYDLNLLRKWKKRNNEGTIDLSFGDRVNFDTIVEVMRILEDRRYSICLSTYTNDTHAIFIDIHPRHYNKPNQRVEPTLVPLGDSVNEQGSAAHP